ncbi:hypothetical protein C7B61_20355 [filamentous cyanobacterium CCP1]|nr:hypothetical protein C7B76_13830 [filamentous cyanobacterium CCP2]PSB56692.1 hypothetical protein C7B61_20355 [filamentous cyanobacterium CCP1]
MQRKKYFIPTAMTALVVFLLGGCGRNADLETVERFVTLAESAATEFSNIAGDIYDSCIRSAEYQPILLDSPPGVDAFELRQIRLNGCNEEPRQLEAELLTTHAVLIHYLRTMGRLAANETVNFDGVSAVRESFQAIPTLEPNHVQAGLGILDIFAAVLQVAVEQSRLRTIRQIVTLADSDLQTFVQGFTTITQRGYLSYLDREEAAIENYYRTYINGVLADGDTDTQSRTIFVMGLTGEWQAARESVRQRREVADRYVALMQEIASDHNSLKQKFEAGNPPTTAELSQLIEGHTVELEALVHELNIAFED